MKFIQLTYENDIKTNVNISKARELLCANSVTYIYYGDNDYIKVIETPEEILSLWNIDKVAK